MSLVNLDTMAPADLIAHYVLECRGQGLFLPYQEYQVVEEWLVLCSHPDELLLILSDILPKYFRQDGADTQRRAPRSLGGVRRLVVSRLKDRAMQQQER